MNPGGSNLCIFISGFSRALLRCEFHQTCVGVEPVLTGNAAIRHLLLIFSDQLEGWENQAEIRLEDLAVGILRDLRRKHGDSLLSQQADIARDSGLSCGVRLNRFHQFGCALSYFRLPLAAAFSAVCLQETDR